MTWPIVLLGDICQIDIGRTPARDNPSYWANGKQFPWLSISDMNQGRFITTTRETITELAVRACNCRLVPVGTLLLSFKLSIGKVSFNSVPLYTNEAIAALYVRNEQQVFKPYLYWALQFVDLLRYVDTAAKGKTLNKRKLHEVEIPFPPLPEQRRIAAILDAADGLRAKRRAALGKLDALVRGVFLEMFGEPIGNPKRWPVVELKDVCTKITDGTHQPPKWAESGIPFLFVSNVVNGELQFNTTKFISLETYEELHRRSPIELGDILYTIVGSYGNAAMVTTERPFSFQRHIAHLKPDTRKVVPDFLLGMLQSSDVKRQVDGMVRGLAQKTLNLRELKEVKILLPDREAQERYSCIRSRIIKQRHHQGSALAQLDRLFCSLQQRAFRGEL